MNLDINKLSKTEEGRIQVLEELTRAANSRSQLTDKLCWQYYNNQFDEHEFDYLRKVGDSVLPAKVRHIPIQRKYVSFLESRQLERSFPFSVSATDQKSLRRKHSEKFSFYADEYLKRFRKIYNEVGAQLQQINEQKQQIYQQLKQQPRNQEEAEQQQQIKQQLPQIEAQMQNIIQSLQDVQILQDNSMKELDRLRRYTNKDIIEEVAQKAMKAYRQRLNLKTKSVQGLINKIVTGKRYSLVTYVPGDKEITFKVLPPHQVFFQDTNNIEWVHQLRWAGYEEWMGASSIIDRWRNKLTTDQVEVLQRKTVDSTATSSGNTTGAFVVSEDGQKVIDPGPYANITTGAMAFENGINVKHVWWLAERKVVATQRPNEYRPGRYFTQFHEEDKPVLDRKEFYFDTPKGQWKHKQKGNNTAFSSNDAYVIDSRKGESIYTRYIDDRYYGVVIDNSIRLAELDPIQPRSIDDFSESCLPIVGPTFNNITMQPYSYIWHTRDLQKLYNIVHFHRELMMATAGTKTLLMDIWQKPAHLTYKEWRANMKTGFAEIESKKSGVNHMVQGAGFNQFQVLDLSISNSIQYFDRILESLDMQIGLLMGVSRQAMGQTVNADQVGTFEMSQQSTLLVTETLYAQHDEIERQEMMMMINLAREYLWDKDQILSYINENNEEEIIDIPAGMLNMADYEIYLARSVSEERKLNELKSFAMNNYSKGALSFTNFLNLYDVESLKEMVKKSQSFDAEMQKIKQMSADADINREKELEQMKISLKLKMQGEMKEQENKIKQFYAQLDAKKQDFLEYIQKKELELKTRTQAAQEEKNEQDVYTKLIEIFTKNDIDIKTLQQAEGNNMFQNQIALINTNLARIKNTLEGRKIDNDYALKSGSMMSNYAN